MNYRIIKEDTEINSKTSSSLIEESFEERISIVLDSIKDLLMVKNKAYGNSALEPVRIFSKASPTEQLLVRIDDKLSRIRNGDTTEDVVLDLIGYLVLLRIS